MAALVEMRGIERTYVMGDNLVYALRGVDLTSGATGTRAEIRLQGAGQFKTLTLAGPDRLVVDLPASSASPGLKLPPGSGIVRAVRTGKPAKRWPKVFSWGRSCTSASKASVSVTAAPMAMWCG